MDGAETIAKVAVAAAPYSIDKPYDYLVPAPLKDLAQTGTRVTVPFGRGNRSSEGVILALQPGRRTPGLKTIEAVLDREPVLSSGEIALASFLRQRYFCTMFDAVRTVLPAGLWYRIRQVYRLADGLDEETAILQAGEIAGGAETVRFLFACGGTADLDTLKDVCGEHASEALRELCQKGILTSNTEAQRKIHDKIKQTAHLGVDAQSALEEAERTERTAPVRSEALRFLAANETVSVSELCYYTGVSARTLRSLQKTGFLTFSEEEDLRIPPAPSAEEPALPIVLNDEQRAAYENILTLMRAGKPAVSLLEGVTGSGKTEIYLQLVHAALSQGRTALMLVPEIVLTPQMMRKFSAQFGSRVAMLHSSLKLSERYDQWKRIRRGEVDVVLGTRSAIFAPLEHLGLILLDEEQEGSYQSENPPRYHTRDVAKFRCTQDGAILVLGSATPSVESSYAARQGIYQHNLLRKRYHNSVLPQVKIADLRQEIRDGNAGSLSRTLTGELEKNLAAGEQSILFLNRRGNSRMLVCVECGRAPECPRCSIPLTYHSANGRLMCHYCGHSERAYERCPACGGYMKHIGTGTQKVEEELCRQFPGVGIVRMDADTVAAGHETLLRKFEQEKIPILLGTQMVTKGLDFENVTLVGVLAADLSLYVDSFRAAERTFSLLTQVVGRAGRGEKSGRAVIQTFTPDSEVIRSAAEQDYDRFYDSELRLRRIRRDPPFADLFVFTVSGCDESRVLRAASRLRDELIRLAGAPEMRDSEPEVLGPAPAPVLKVNNRYRYRVTLVGRNDRTTRERISWLLKWFSTRGENRGVHLFADCNAME